MEQQGTSTPTGVSASDPAPDQIIQESGNPLVPAPEVARRIEDGVEANIPGGWAVRQESTRLAGRAGDGSTAVAGASG